RPLTWLQNSRDLSSKLMRWSLLISDFTFDIVYKPGEEMPADALSRLLPQVCTTTVEVDATSRIITAQREDPWSLELLNYLEQGVYPENASTPEKHRLMNESRKFVVRSGTLYRKWSEPGTGHTRPVESFLLVVPKGLRQHVLTKSHNDPLAGHRGVT